MVSHLVYRIKELKEKSIEFVIKQHIKIQERDFYLSGSGETVKTRRWGYNCSSTTLYALLCFANPARRSRDRPSTNAF